MGAAVAVSVVLVVVDAVKRLASQEVAALQLPPQWFSIFLFLVYHLPYLVVTEKVCKEENVRISLSYESVRTQRDAADSSQPAGQRNRIDIANVLSSLHKPLLFSQSGRSAVQRGHK